MNRSPFKSKIDRLQYQAGRLRRDVQIGPSSLMVNLPEVLDELQRTLEELRVAEEELRQQNDELSITRAAVEAERSRYEDLFNFAPDPYAVTDAKGVIREANQAAGKMLSVEPKDLIGKPLVVFVDKEDRQAFLRRLSQMEKLKLVTDWQLRLQPRNGIPFYAAITVAFVSHINGKAGSLRWLIRDITERKQAEDRLAAAALENAQLLKKSIKQGSELEVANRLKEEFLSVVSHELRMPLNSIIGYTGLMLDALPGEINQGQKEFLGKIMSRSKDLLEMINGILEACRLQAGDVKTESREINLASFLSDLSSRYQVPLNEEITLIWDFSPGLPKLNTDATKLRHILENLLNNAIKYTNKGSITMSARLVKVGGQGSGISASPRPPTPNRQFVEFKVADTGIGISKEMITVIFEKFRQANSSDTRSLGGVGLGLHIVKQFTELLGGTVEVESEAGKGSTFTVRIPCGQ